MKFKKLKKVFLNAIKIVNGNRFNYLKIVFICTLLLSCKKTEYHKLAYEIEFLGIAQGGFSNWFEISATPNYSQKVNSNRPGLDKNKIKVGSVWRYEYNWLEKGDKIYFSVGAQGTYYIKMNLYIDGELYSYMKVYFSPGSYGLGLVEEKSGKNDNNDQYSIIEIKY